MSKLEIIKPGPIRGPEIQPDTSALRRNSPIRSASVIPSKTGRGAAATEAIDEDEVDKRPPERRHERAGGTRPLSDVTSGDFTQMFGYAALGVLALYAYKSYTDGGVDVDGSGQKRNLFRWVDAACGALIGAALFRFARTMY